MNQHFASWLECEVFFVGLLEETATVFVSLQESCMYMSHRIWTLKMVDRIVQYKQGAMLDSVSLCVRLFGAETVKVSQSSFCLCLYTFQFIHSSTHIKWNVMHIKCSILHSTPKYPSLIPV